MENTGAKSEFDFFMAAVFMAAVFMAVVTIAGIVGYLCGLSFALPLPSDPQPVVTSAAQPAQAPDLTELLTGIENARRTDMQGIAKGLSEAMNTIIGEVRAMRDEAAKPE